jgi:hypothetical protein
MAHVNQDLSSQGLLCFIFGMRELSKLICNSQQRRYALLANFWPVEISDNVMNSLICTPAPVIMNDGKLRGQK